MANHPNRSGNSVARNPSPEEIARTRHDKGLSIADACALIHTTQKTWSAWESGDRRMHPAFWELFTVKIERVRF